MAEDMAVPEQAPSTFCARFDEFPEMKKAQLGDVVELRVRGKVVSLRSPDKYSKGEATLEVKTGNMDEEESSKIKQPEKPLTKEDKPEEMPLNELRDRLPKKEED